MPTPQYGDYQMEIYGAGLQEKQPRFPLDYASLEQAAAEVLPFWVYSYVATAPAMETPSAPTSMPSPAMESCRACWWVRPSETCRYHCLI